MLVKPPTRKKLIVTQPPRSRKLLRTMEDKLIKVEIKDKVDALPGTRVRAVGMCFYKPSKDLVPGQTYRLFRNP